MHVSPGAFREIVTATLGSRDTGYREGAALGEDEAVALVRIAHLALAADDREDSDEVEVVHELVAQLCVLANTGAIASPELAHGDGDRLARIRDLGRQLRATPARELAYALAYLVSIADLELAPAEQALVDTLAPALGLAGERAAELAILAARAVTPADG